MLERSLSHIERVLAVFHAPQSKGTKIPRKRLSYAISDKGDFKRRRVESILQRLQRGV